jgi:dipeptidyl aminopeptidase/acylaminoacyl peptidase
MIDPGDGTVRSPRFIVQEPKADAERTELPIAVAWSANRTLVTPRHAEVELNGRKVGGLVYRPIEISGLAPIVVYLGERPETARTAGFDAFAQSLVASGLAVFAPTLPGTPGYGKKITNALKEGTVGEAEVDDLLALHAALEQFEGIDYGRVAVIGRGYGATLALLFAGSRPGHVQAVAAIDPITDWDTEFDNADAGFRAWLGTTYGIPALARGVYALRTPSTFAGVIDAPLLLIGTDDAPVGRADQLEELLSDLADLEVTSFEHETAHGASDWELGQTVASFLRRSLTAAASPVDARVEQALEAAAI